MIKNNNKEKYFRLSAMASNYWNKKNENLLLNKINSIEKEKDKNNSKSKIMKYTPVNLNGFAKIPNRLIKFDKYGNKLEEINDNNKTKNKEVNINNIYAFQKLKEHMLNKISLIKKKIK